MVDAKVVIVASGLPVITSLTTSGCLSFQLLAASQPDKMIARNNL
jgi:hypothetical protein